MNYLETFIEVADDCPAAVGLVPPQRGTKKSVANLHYELLAENPYELTQEDLLFETHLKRKGLTLDDDSYADNKNAFFAKPQACLRTSPLAKRYGWGFHFDAQGKIALFSRDSESYEAYRQDKQLKTLMALRSSRK